MPRDQASAFANATPTRSDPTSPGPCVTATASICFDGDGGVGERRFEHAADVADVLPRRELGDDAPPLPVNRGLRGDDARTDLPGAGGVAGLRHHGGGRFVAGRLDREQHHRTSVGVEPSTPSVRVEPSSAFFSDSLYGAVKMPRSVMIPPM